MKTLFYWLCLFFATKAIALETYICSWDYDEDGNPIKYKCDLLSDDAEKSKESDPFKFKIDGD